jgi:hypothetical protein
MLEWGSLGPDGATCYKISSPNAGAGVAQLVERDLAKVEVVGSRPITRSIFSLPRRFQVRKKYARWACSSRATCDVAHYFTSHRKASHLPEISQVLSCPVVPGRDGIAYAVNRERRAMRPQSRPMGDAPVGRGHAAAKTPPPFWRRYLFLDLSADQIEAENLRRPGRSL